jgi:hypothetical protein
MVTDAFHFVHLTQDKPACDQKYYLKSFLKLLKGASMIFLLWFVELGLNFWLHCSGCHHSLYWNYWFAFLLCLAFDFQCECCHCLCGFESAVPSLWLLAVCPSVFALISSSLLALGNLHCLLSLSNVKDYGVFLFFSFSTCYVHLFNLDQGFKNDCSRFQKQFIIIDLGFPRHTVHS